MKTYTRFTLIGGLVLVVPLGWSDSAPAPAERPREIAAFRAYDFHISSLAFSPDGRFLASGGHDGWVKLWGVADCVRTYEQFLRKSSSGRDKAKDSPSPSWPASEKVITIHAHKQNPGAMGIVDHVKFSLDGKNVLSCGDDRMLRFWDAATGKPTDVIKSVSMSFLEDMLYTRDRKSIICGHDWVDLATKKVRPADYRRTWQAASFDPKGKLLLAAYNPPPTDSHQIIIYAADTGDPWGPGEKLATYKEHKKGAVCLAFHPDGKTIASAGLSEPVRIWDWTTGKTLAVLDKLPKWRLCHFKFSPDGKILALEYVTEDENLWSPGRILLIEVPSGKLVATLKGHDSLISCMTFSLTGRLLATGDYSGFVRIWQLPASYKAE